MSRTLDVNRQEMEADKEKIEILVEQSQGVTDDPESATVYLEGAKLAITMLAVFGVLFLVALDRFVLATAIPRITDDFHTVDHVGWYGSAYLLTWCGFALQYGKIYSLYNAKIAYIVAIVLFEVGSVICATSPTSPAFIIGRAVCGVGSAGIGSGSIVMMVHSLPLHKRAVYLSMLATVFGLASIVGPIIGGALTTHLSWRWCFWISLPPGILAIPTVWIWVPVPQQRRASPSKSKRGYLVGSLRQLDILGSIVFVPGMTCLILVLELGGTTLEWRDGRVIGLIAVAGTCLITFIFIQYRLPLTATLPGRIILQRSIAWGAFAAFCTGASQLIFVYYLTIWFQVIDRLTAMESGIRILPLLLGMIAATLFSGVLVRFIGYYMVPMYLGLLFMAVGAGLLTTLNEKTSLPSRIGYQLLYGWGMGCVNQAPNLAAQAVLPLADVPIGTATMFFFQCLGGAIFIPVGQNVMISQLLKRLAGMSAFDPSLLKSSGATTINQFTGADEVIFLHAYNSSLVEVFRVGLVLTCVMGLSALRMECKSTKTAKAEEVHSTEGGRGDHDEIPVMDDIDHNLFEFYRAHTPDVGACVEAMGRKR